MMIRAAIITACILGALACAALGLHSVETCVTLAGALDGGAE